MQVNYTEKELQELVALIDLAVKAAGVQIAEVAGRHIAKLEKVASSELNGTEKPKRKPRKPKEPEESPFVD